MNRLGATESGITDGRSWASLQRHPLEKTDGLTPGAADSSGKNSARVTIPAALPGGTDTTGTGEWRGEEQDAGATRQGTTKHDTAAENVMK